MEVDFRVIADPVECHLTHLFIVRKQAGRSALASDVWPPASDGLAFSDRFDHRVCVVGRGDGKAGRGPTAPVSSPHAPPCRVRRWPLAPPPLHSLHPTHPALP